MNGGNTKVEVFLKNLIFRSVTLHETLEKNV